MKKLSERFSGSFLLQLLPSKEEMISFSHRSEYVLMCVLTGVHMSVYDYVCVCSVCVYINVHKANFNK